VRGKGIKGVKALECCKKPHLSSGFSMAFYKAERAGGKKRLLLVFAAALI